MPVIENCGCKCPPTVDCGNVSDFDEENCKCICNETKLNAECDKRKFKFILKSLNFILSQLKAPTGHQIIKTAHVIAICAARNFKTLTTRNANVTVIPKS